MLLVINNDAVLCPLFLFPSFHFFWPHFSSPFLGQGFVYVCRSLAKLFGFAPSLLRFGFGLFHPPVAVFSGRVFPPSIFISGSIYSWWRRWRRRIRNAESNRLFFFDYFWEEWIIRLTQFRGTFEWWGGGRIADRIPEIFLQIAHLWRGICFPVSVNASWNPFY